MKTKTRFAVLCGCVLALVACKTTDTKFSQSYRNPGYEETSFKKVMVIGVAQDQKARQAFEDALVSAIAKEGGTAQASIAVLPNEEQISEDQLHAAIDAGGFDAVLITRVLSVDKSQQYTPPKKYNNPQTRYYPGSLGWGHGYGGYYGFYGTTFAEVHEPGYFETSTTLRLETNLYSVATNELVWTGQSATIDPQSIDDARSSMTQAVAKKLKEERFIP
ncbi:MAG TPA: hypothetical protein VFG22_11470 [Polyangiales bacterium]|nr:hypothetical protein [Polyangiales bacterium]